MTKILSDNILDVLAMHDESEGLSKYNGGYLIDNVRRLKEALSIALNAKQGRFSVFTEGELDSIRELVGDE